MILSIDMPASAQERLIAVSFIWLLRASQRHWCFAQLQQASVNTMHLHGWLCTQVSVFASIQTCRPVSSDTKGHPDVPSRLGNAEDCPFHSSFEDRFTTLQAPSLANCHKVSLTAARISIWPVFRHTHTYRASFWS